MYVNLFYVNDIHVHIRNLIRDYYFNYYKLLFRKEKNQIF